MISISAQIQEKLGSKISAFRQPALRRVYFSVMPGDIREVGRVLFSELGLRFVIATGQDTPEGIEILYHFAFDKSGEVVSLRTLLTDKKSPRIDSLAVLFPAAEWIEREMWELLGIDFIGHPNLKRLLLAEEWPQGKYPLRHENEP